MQKANIEEPEVIYYYLKFNSIRLTAKFFGVCDETIRRILIQNQIPRVGYVQGRKRIRKTSRPRKLTNEEIKKIIDDYYNTGETIVSVGKKHHRSPEVVSEIIKQYGHGIKYNAINSKKITDQQILDGIAEGLTRVQIADRYGIHVENLAKKMTRLGVHARHAPGYVFQSKAETNTWHYTESGNRLVHEKQNGRFKFVAYKNRKYRIKCAKCGKEFEKDASSIRRHHISCDRCQKEEKELKEARAKLVRVLFCVKEIKTPKICKECGEVFYSQYPNAVYCSAKCKRRKKHTNIRSRCRKYGVYYDPSVTPEKVFKRDHYRCGICGLYCIKGDTSWNGHFGAYSPTIDHIVALANGGSHTWDNVQCAHAICNSNKRDLITV
jgi:hypothetical protein